MLVFGSDIPLVEIILTLGIITVIILIEVIAVLVLLLHYKKLEKPAPPSKRVSSIVKGKVMKLKEKLK